MKLLLICLIAFLSTFSYSQCTSSGTPLATSYASDNGGKGVMFNIVATNLITIQCFDVNLVLGSVGSYEVYYKVGSYVGSETNAAAWTLLGSNPSVPCAGFDFPSPLDIPVNIVIPAGQTYAFYITSTNVSATTGARYTNGTGYTTLASDANLTIAGGVGKGYPFLATFANRKFNGTVHYLIGNALPVELSAFHAENAGEKVRISWQTASERNSDRFRVERSADGTSWNTIATVQAAGTTFVPTTYAVSDDMPLYGISYYRLVQTDADGQTEHFDMQAVNRQASFDAGVLTAFPNPASEQLRIEGSPKELGEIGVFSITGRSLLGDVSIVQLPSYTTIDVSRLEQQVVILHAGNCSARIVVE